MMVMGSRRCGLSCACPPSRGGRGRGGERGKERGGKRGGEGREREMRIPIIILYFYRRMKIKSNVPELAKFKSQKQSEHRTGYFLNQINQLKIK